MTCERGRESESKFSCILMQAIAIACCFKDEGSILIVCPAVLRYTWAEELERWDPSFMPKDIHLGTEYLCFCWCENWYLSHLFVNCTIHYLLIIMKSCLITHSVLLPYRFFTFMWFKLSICFLFAFFLLQNLLAHTLSSNKAWNPALYCINLTFCVLVKQNAEIWISVVGWNVISLWSSKMRLIICLIPGYSLIYLGQFFSSIWIVAPHVHVLLKLNPMGPKSAQEGWENSHLQLKPFRLDPNSKGWFVHVFSCSPIYYCAPNVSWFV